MGVLGLLALHSKRTTNVTITILATATTMTVWNPFVLHDDIGFQLSFSAVMGLVYIGPLISWVFQKVPPVVGLKESLVLTLAAQVSSTPIILYHFFQGSSRVEQHSLHGYL
jgi:competence protein ComEC